MQSNQNSLIALIKQKIFHYLSGCRASIFRGVLKRRLSFDGKLSIAKVANSSAARKGLFIDCGSNVGQGFTEFRKYYPLEYFDYILIEPNQNCIPYLEKMCNQLVGKSSITPHFLRSEQLESSNIQIIAEAASTQIGYVQFFGLTEESSGLTSVGGSILKDHNSKFYTPNEDKAITVKTFSLSDLIKAKANQYNTIILKLDIEGGEYDVLDDLIKNKTHLLLDKSYVEFHSQYMVEPKRSKYEAIERDLIRKFKTDSVTFRLWV